MPLATCPSCATRLTVPDTLAAGQAIRCPKCKEVFQPEAASAPVGPPPDPGAYQAPAHLPQAAETVPARSGAVVLGDRDFPDDWQRSRGRRRGGKGLLIGGILGGVALLAVAGTVLWLLLGGRSGLSDELKDAPADTRFVMSFDVRAILRSSAAQQFKKSEAYRELNKIAQREGGMEAEKFLEEMIGLKLEDLQRVTIMGTWEEDADRDFWEPPAYTVVV